MTTPLQIIRQGFKLLMESGRFDRVLEKVSISRRRSSDLELILFLILCHQVVITAAENGNLQAEMEVCPEHTNRGGSLHGGFTATLVDQMSTLALLTHTDENLAAGVSIELNVSFLSPANVGDHI